jgi:asparagine synthetase B (glutamine-hydrolysing)
MSGITAFIRFQEESPPLERLLDRTLKATCPLPDLKIVTAQTNTAHVVFGGTFPKHFQRQAETISEGGMDLLLYGELYNELGGKDEAEFALNCIRRGDDNELRNLNGPFTLLLHNSNTHDLTIITDRLGRFPVFCGKFGETLFFTTDLHSLFNAGVIAPHLDDESMADFLTIGFPLGDQSLFRGVRRITGGTVVTISRSGVTRRTYWDHRCENSLEDTDALVSTFRECVSRAVKRAPKIAITLSGGWDSRATVAALPATADAEVWAVTYGVPESSDARIARRVAERLHIPHELAPVDEAFFDNFSGWTDKVLKLSGGHATRTSHFSFTVMTSCATASRAPRQRGLRISARYPRPICRQACAQQ